MIDHVRCSSLKRYMYCAGFAFMENLPENETNPAAEEGTAAGEYLATLLTKGRVDTTHAVNGVLFDKDIIFYATDAAKEIMSRAKTGLLCETYVPWKTPSGIEIRGSYDISYEMDQGTTLVIDDLKYGWGIVEVFENWQLIGYAIGEIIRRQRAYAKIVLRIIQPRPHHEDGSIREWVLSYEELLGYKDQIEEQMAFIALGNKQLVTGSHCKYCAAAAQDCPALNRAMYASVDYVLSNFTQDALTLTEISEQLKLLERVGDIFKIKKDSLDALAINKLNNNNVIPGYSIEKKLGHRVWNKSVSPKVIAVLTGKDITEPTMLSPAQAEKIGVPKELVKAFTSQHFAGMRLVKKDSTIEANKIFGNPNK